MTAAYIYFTLMAALVMPLAVVHMFCRDVVKRAPQIMPDDIQRDRFRWMELAMAFTCLAMIFYMWLILDFMEIFCGTQPFLGALAHGPWIAGTAGVLGTKTGHLMRLRSQAMS